MNPAAADVHAVASGGFSGARVWRVDFQGQSFALRQWPPAMHENRLQGLHLVQRWLIRDGLPVPKPMRERATGRTFVLHDKHIWEFAMWMPGVANYHPQPQPEKLAAALRSLAELHCSIGRMPVVWPEWVETTRVSPALMRRSERLCNLVLSDLNKLKAILSRVPADARQQLATQALGLIEQTAEVELGKAQRWETTALPLQMCLRDVWHDHILFTGSQVTGIIDFGAMGFDSPAGDVARLLGSMVGDDREGWRLGLEAYQAVRPLSADERDAVDFFDSSGVVLSAVNWIHWLYRDVSALPVTVDRAKAYQRLQRLTTRLGVLAATSRS